MLPPPATPRFPYTTLFRSGDPRRHAEEVRARAARSGRRPGEERDLRREQRPHLRLQAVVAGRARYRSALQLQGALRRGRRRAHQPRLWVRAEEVGLTRYLQVGFLLEISTFLSVVLSFPRAAIFATRSHPHTPSPKRT